MERGTGQEDFPVLGAPSRFAHDHYYSRKRKRILAKIRNMEMLEVKQQQREKSRAKLARRYGKAESDVFMRDSSYVGPIDTRNGVQLTSREITSLGERPGYTGDHTMSDATIKETPWDLARIVERPTLVSSFLWTVTSSPILYTGAVPASILPIRLAKIPFDAFQYWRGDVVLRLQVAGSPILQGILCMTFVPLVTKDELDTVSWDLSSLSINPTVYLYANTNTHAELRIPYNHVQSYLTTDFPSIR